MRIGTLGGDTLVLNGETVTLAELKLTHEATLPAMIKG
jgi:phosphoribosylformylglycinamidine synthase